MGRGEQNYRENRVNGSCMTEEYESLQLYIDVNKSSNQHKIEMDTPETEVQGERVCVRLD